MGNTNNIMYVIGATNEQEFRSIRKIIPDHFLLVPGIGAQGGDLKAFTLCKENDVLHKK